MPSARFTWSYEWAPQPVTGDYLEPAGKEGLVGLTGYLLARGGTKSKTAEQMEERLEFLAAMLNSSTGNTEGRVGLNLMKKDLDEGLAILREVLTAPRFQDEKIALRKQQLLQDMKQRNDDSSNIEGRERSFLAYGENFFVNRLSTGASIESIARADLEAFHQKWFHPANFVIAVNGDFDRSEMSQKLEALFADWPFKGETAPPVPTNAKLAAPGVYLVGKDVNQGRVAVMLPGILRDVWLSRWFFDGSLQAAAWIAVLLLAIFIVLFVLTRSFWQPPHLLLTAALLVTLLVSPYLYNYDFLMLLVPFAVMSLKSSLFEKIAVLVCYLAPTLALIVYGRKDNLSLIIAAAVLLLLLSARAGKLSLTPGDLRHTIQTT